MNIIKIYNRTNWELLETIKRERLNLRDIAKRLNRSPATVHNNLRLLRDFNVVRIEKEKHQYFIIPNMENFYYRSFMRLVNYESMRKCRSFKHLEKMGIVGIYGSFARGSDERGSDIDMFVFGIAREIKIREMVNRMSREMNREINLLILNEGKLKDLKKTDYEFYVRLMLESIMFNGDIFA